MRHPRGTLFAAIGTVILLTATACGSANAGSGSGDLSLQITSPRDGAKVSEPFTVTVDASVPLGDPSTGDHHVHLCFDGASCDQEYTLVYGNTFQVTDLAPGRHTMEASLRNADHSDAGAPTDSITITVSGGGATGNATSPSPSPTMSRPSYG